MVGTNAPNRVANTFSLLKHTSTVGGAGLAARYAKVVLLAESCLHAPATMRQGVRAAFYG